MAETPVAGDKKEPRSNAPRTLSIDIGGTGLKCSVLDGAGAMLHAKVWQATPDPCPPATMLSELKSMADSLGKFDRVSAGFPGAVRNGRVITAPHFPDPQWPGFDLAAALAEMFGKPARVLNDAEVQGYGVISGQGLEFVLTLGTGAGTALFSDGTLAPHMEFAHHPVHANKTYNDYIGRDALAKVGKKKWNKRVHKVVGILDALIHYDHLYIGGGNGVKVQDPLPSNATIVSNDAGITGGIALWRDAAKPAPPQARSSTAKPRRAVSA